MATDKRSIFSHRGITLIGLIICCVMLAVAYYAQYFNGLEPCPLCILQRISLIILALLFLAATLHRSTTKITRVYAVLISLFSILGGLVAARQIWLEMQPATPDALCMPSWTYMLTLFPSSQAWKLLLNGNASCSIVSWTFLGLSIATWTLFCFILLAITGFLLMTRRFKRIN